MTTTRHAQKALQDMTPPPIPLSMPTQAVHARRVAPPPCERDGRWRLALVLGGAALITAFAVREMEALLGAGGVSLIEKVALGLFALNFFWIAAANGTAFVGAARLFLGRAKHGAPVRAFTSRSKTALLFPVYNEDIDEVIANAEAAYLDLKAKGAAHGFETFFLSDTREEGRVEQERRAMQAFRARYPQAEIHYRRRAINSGKKAGNIADFVSNWGGRYDYMIVFDADSAMSGEALCELVMRMDERPRSAIIQTLPVIIKAETVFARTQQFALRAYGAMFGAGLAWWSGGASNYWGHNAIIRVRAFAAHAGLPVLPGRAPFGGHILSHDFVEAAFLRRAGWRIELAPDIEGSYEQSPPTLSDFAVRDRRWAQGNLQHLSLLGARGLDWVSRAHIASGVMAYLSSLFWMALIIAGVGLGYQAQAEIPNYFSYVSLLPTWPVLDQERALRLILLTAAIVFSPKWLALLLWAFGRLPGWGRQGAFLGGLIAETLVSVLTAPILMACQATSVVHALLGVDAGWRAQVRTRSGFDLSFMREALTPMAMALVLVGAYLALSPGSAAWTAPVAFGLFFAAPLSLWLAQTARPHSFLWALTAIPEERATLGSCEATK